MHEKRRSKTYIIEAIILLLSMGIGGCGREPEDTDAFILIEQEAEEEEFSLCVATRCDIEQSVTINCQYVAVHSEGISYDTDGQVIREVFVREGDTVAAGQLLVSLAKEDIAEQITELEYTIARNEILLEQVLAQKQEQIDIAELEYSYTNQWYMDLEAHEERLAQIEEDYAYTIEDYEDRLYIDRLKLEQLQVELNEGKLYAGISGTVVYVKPELEGSVTVADERIITITDSNECVFSTDRVEEAVYFEEGMPVTIEIPVGMSAGSYEVLPILPKQEGDSLQFVLSGEDADTQIDIGTRGNITVVLERREDVLSIRPEALYSSDGKYYVYVLKEDGTQQVAWVEIGMKTKYEVEILSGLEEGDKVILQ